MWKSYGERAPHKTLLVLLAFGQLLNNKKNISYEEIAPKLKDLLEEFGPPRKNQRPQYPFIRLVNDGIWDIKADENLDTLKDYSNSFLISTNVIGRFKSELIQEFNRNPSLLLRITKILLNDNFPESLHEDILQASGIDLSDHKIKKRDSQFRDRVIKAYEYKCAVCGFNVRLSNALVAIEAAHIRWHQAGGPDTEDNGIALCSMHHKLFDRGVFTVNKNMEFIVSDRAHGSDGFKDWLLRFHGNSIRNPQNPHYFPKESYLQWHFKEVFKGKARYV